MSCCFHKYKTHRRPYMKKGKETLKLSPDAIAKDFWTKDERFADLFNEGEWLVKVKRSFTIHIYE